MVDILLGNYLPKKNYENRKTRWFRIRHHKCHNVSCDSQLQDILKFGVDKLLENDSSSLEAMDFDRMLGLSSDGQWQTAAATESAIGSSDRKTVSSLSV